MDILKGRLVLYSTIGRFVGLDRILESSWSRMEVQWSLYTCMIVHQTSLRHLLDDISLIMLVSLCWYNIEDELSAGSWRWCQELASEEAHDAFPMSGSKGLRSLTNV
jgi:hypothetical protein